MAGYKVSQGSLFGRIGTEMGKGLAEQIPKEAERTRLSQGLAELGKQQGLSPFEQFAKLSAIPGITPQMIQSGSELLKSQAQRNAYQRDPLSTRQEPSVTESIKNTPFEAGQGKGSTNRVSNEPKEQTGAPQVQADNPLAPEYTTRSPWSKERNQQEVKDLLDFYPNMTVPEAQVQAKENEARELAQPIAKQTEYDRLQGKKDEIRTELTRQLGTKLQKDKEGSFKDISGEDQIQLERNVEKDLRENPKLSVSDAVNKWTNKATDYAKSKDQLRGLAGSNIFALPLIFNKGQLLTNLKEYQKTFADFGNLDEFYNILQSDVGLSPQGAAQVAYPPSQKINEYLNKIKVKGINEGGIKNSVNRSKRYADDILALGVTNRDSLLGVMRSIQERDPYFDQNAFLDIFKENREAIPASKRFDRELQKGSQVLPSWPDVLILPTFRKV
jgi:hypothetical protein